MRNFLFLMVMVGLHSSCNEHDVHRIFDVATFCVFGLLLLMFFVALYGEDFVKKFGKN